VNASLHRFCAVSVFNDHPRSLTRSFNRYLAYGKFVIRICCCCLLASRALYTVYSKLESDKTGG
jgi:hypothetical protein